MDMHGGFSFRYLGDDPGFDAAFLASMPLANGMILIEIERRAEEPSIKRVVQR